MAAVPEGRRQKNHSLEEPRMNIKQSVLVACACLFLLPGKSFADPARATVLIDNQSGRTVVYEYKWGSEPWKVDNLQHGRHVTHGKPYDPKGVPPMYVRFATAPTFDGGAKKTYTLVMGWDNQPKRYCFEAKNNGVDLIRVTGEARKAVRQLVPKSKRSQRIDDN